MISDGVNYSARDDYVDDAVVESYMQKRFDGRLGQYRFRREQHGVNTIIALIDPTAVKSVLDCPTGIGRWIPNLAVLDPLAITAADVSQTMLRKAAAIKTHVSVTVTQSTAEDLPFSSGQFDVVFCHALLKHLPTEVQGDVIRELTRVSSRYVVCTLSVLRGASGLLRSLRRAGGAVAVTEKWFLATAKDAGLSVVASRKVTTPIGAEYCYLLEKSR